MQTGLGVNKIAHRLLRRQLTFVWISSLSAIANSIACTPIGQSSGKEPVPSLRQPPALDAGYGVGGFKPNLRRV
jgi:hypothetical protein